MIKFGTKTIVPTFRFDAAKNVNLFEIHCFVFVTICMQFLINFSVFYLNLKSILHEYQRLILNFVDGENVFRHKCEVVDD